MQLQLAVTPGGYEDFMQELVRTPHVRTQTLLGRRTSMLRRQIGRQTKKETERQRQMVRGAAKVRVGGLWGAFWNNVFTAQIGLV